MVAIETLCLWGVALPLLAGIIVGIFQRLPRSIAQALTVISVGLSFVISCVIFKRLVWGSEEAVNSLVYTWGQSFDLRLEVGFLIDRLSAMLMIVVTFISWMVHIYSIGYMKEDPGIRRFLSYISLFTFAMLVLVMANNFLQLFFGWEAVGLMSYLLIGFWFHKDSANRASLKAFLVNRVSDVAFLIGIAAVLFYFGSLDYQTVFANTEYINNLHKTFSITSNIHCSAHTLICVCLLIGAMGKSAQIPLHVWLPDSMEGPTPISALIHAATMVTAGVFMLARLSPLFEYSNIVLNIILVVGSLTCLFMGILGCVQSDIKRIIAYSTLSQLGYMMMAMGASAYAVGIFHLITHAFFKALLFLGAGSVIMGLHHEQNIWKMGGVRRWMPVTYGTFLMGSLALIGFPFFSGFYSKELIIEAVHASHLSWAPMAYGIALFSVFVTALYTFRLVFVVFHGIKRWEIKDLSHQSHGLHESPSIVIWPLLLLAIPSVIVGFYCLQPMVNGFLGQAIITHPHHPSIMHLREAFIGAIPMALQGFMRAPFWLGMAGIWVAWLFYLYCPSLPNRVKTRYIGLDRILKAQYGFDKCYEWIVVCGVKAMGSLFWKVGDRWAIDGIMVNGSAHTVNRLSILGTLIQTGYLYHYVFMMIVGFLFLVAWLIWG